MNPADRLRVADRFWSKVEKTEDCWIWAGSRSGRYGSFFDGDKTVPAHRFCYTLHFGEIPQDYDVHHECQNKLCVRLSHLKSIPRSEHYKLHHPGTGVSRVTKNRWRARARIDGKSVYLGIRPTEEEAAELVREALYGR